MLLMTARCRVQGDDVPIFHPAYHPGYRSGSPHQVNQRILEVAFSELGFPLDLLMLNLEHYGNTSDPARCGWRHHPAPCFRGRVDLVECHIEAVTNEHENFASNVATS